MTRFFRYVKQFVGVNKIWSGLIILALAYGGVTVVRAMTGGTAAPRYVTSTVATDTIITSITGTGQVSSSNEIDIKPKVSGRIVWVGVKPGDVVSAGHGLMSIDDTAARRAVTNAEQSLVTSQLQFQKDEASAPIDYQSSQDSLNSAKDDLATTYNDTFNTLSNTYLDLPNIMTAANNTLYGYDLSPSGKQQWNVDAMISLFNTVQNESDRQKTVAFSQKAEADFTTAQNNYTASLASYKSITRSSSESDILAQLTQAIGTATSVAQAVQSELNFLSNISDNATTYQQKLPATITTMQTSARTNLTNINSDLSSLLSQKKAIDAASQTIKNDQNNINLLQVGNTDGSNPISLQIEKNNLATQEQNLEQLKEDLTDYTIVAPFAGTISAVDVKVGDNASGSAVASIITNQSIAQITLNEVDVSKIKLGDKATVTFDAIPDLSISGQVSEIDTVGTVSQGVVNYGVKISFDTQDTRVKSGMSANASIITSVTPNVLVVPNGAIKTLNGASTVQVFDTPLLEDTTGQGQTSTVPPRAQVVQIGVANDMETQIVSGVTEGQQIVTRTITTTVKTTATTSSVPSLFGAGGGVRAGGGTFRAGAATGR